MSRVTLPAVLIALELLAGGAAIGWRLTQRVPPEVQWARLDPATAEELRELRTRVGRSPERWLQLGEAYLAFGFLPEAEATLAESLRLEPDSFDIRYARGYALQRLGRLDEAIDQLQQAAEIAPPVKESTCWYHIGRGQLRKEATNAAELAFRRHPNFPPSAFQLAKILVRSDRAKEALPILDELDRRFPGSLQPRQLRALAEEALKTGSEPARTRRLIETAPEKVQLTDHHQFLGPTRFRYGAGSKVAAFQKWRSQGQDKAAAAGFLELMESLNAEDQHKLAPMLAELELQLQQPEITERLLMDYFESAAVTPKTLMLFGDAHTMQRHWDQALEIYLRVLQMRPDSEIHRRLSLCFERVKDADKARFHTARALCYEGIEAFRRNELPEALAALNESVRLDPAQDLAWFYLGEAESSSGNQLMARQAYEKCLVLNPHFGRAAVVLGESAL
ncbi:tetratricopeptide repeat protein [Caulifigura coniformis]|nr:tetratricopeptide repeat protein [Caulifigura coniformis]